MSSNGFLQETELLSLPYPAAGLTRTWQRYQLRTDVSGRLLLQAVGGGSGVLLLLNHSFWACSVAAISFRKPGGKLQTLLFLRYEQRPDCWRRARVRWRLLGQPE